MNKERVKWIDQIKGFAIICMVISHAIPGYDIALKNWITAFNMPLFFFVSGILTEDKYNSISELPSWLKKKFYSLGIPYLIFCMIYTMFICSLALISGDSINAVCQVLISKVKSIVFMFGIQSMWFLPVFFFSSLLDAFVMKRIRKRYLSLIVSIFFCMSLLIVDRYIELDMWIRLAGKIVGAEVFIMWGRFLKTVLRKTHTSTRAIGLFIFSALAYINGFVSINFDFGNYPVLFFVNGIMLTFFICAVFIHNSERISGSINQLLCEFGMNSIVILVTNNLIIEILRLLDHKLFNSFCLNHGLPGCLFFALLILIAEYPLIRLSTGKLAFLFTSE